MANPNNVSVTNRAGYFDKFSNPFLQRLIVFTMIRVVTDCLLIQILRLCKILSSNHPLLKNSIFDFCGILQCSFFSVAFEFLHVLQMCYSSLLMFLFPVVFPYRYPIFTYYQYIFYYRFGNIFECFFS